VLVLAAGLAAQRARAQAPAPPAGGKTAAPLSLSIEQVLRRAEGSSERVAIARAAVDRARGDQVRARSELLPSVGASASYDRTFKSEFDNIFPPPGSAQAAQNPIDQLPFGQRNTYRFEVSASQNLYTGGRATAGIDQAAAARRGTEADLASARAQAALEVAQAYFDAVLGARQLAIAQTTLEQAEATLDVARKGQEVGTQAEFEVLRAQVSAGNQRPVVVRRRFDRDLALLKLRQLLDLPEDRPLTLTTELEGDLEAPAAVAQEVAGVPGPDDRPPAVVRGELAAVAGREAAVKSARSGHLPSVAVSTQYGRVAYPNDLQPSWDEFRTNWNAGIALSWSLFSGGRVHGDVLSAEADLRGERARLQQTRELAELDAANARAALKAARAAWEASRGTVDQARRAYEIADLRYREGVSTQLELLSARLALEEAEGQRAELARDLQVARIRVALQPNLPLTSQGAPAAAPPTTTPTAPAPAAPAATTPAPAGTSLTGAPVLPSTRAP
jgi:outer membrane protein TolC